MAANVIHLPTNPVSQLLRDAADALDQRKLCKGHFALGRRDAEEETDTEVFPWDRNLHAVNSVTLLGAICFVAGESTSDARVREAYDVVHMHLRERGVEHTPEVWNDHEDRTKAEVVDVLRASARGRGCRS